MLSYRTKIFRVKAAIMVVVLYAFAILAPHAVMAFAGPNGLVHCLTEAKAGHGHAAPDTHVHADGMAHSHDSKSTAPDSDDSKAPAAACCGLFTATALTYDTRILLPSPAAQTKLVSLFASGFTGQGPGRIIRPPIA